MKPRQLAALLGIAPATLRTWAGKNYRDFLSPKGQGANGAYRSFDEVDARILAWVALMKAQNTSADEIYLTLKTAKANNWRDLPPLPGGIANDEPIAVVPREAVEERFRAIQERHETQLQAVIHERDQLREQLETMHRESSEALNALREEASETAQKLQQRIVELTAQEAELRGRLEQYKIGGRNWNLASLVMLALLIGVILTLVVLLIGGLLR
jgi:DNA-binding transcriptional MerR regulator